MSEAVRRRLSPGEAPTLDSVVGRNIREERRRRGITAEDVEDHCAEYGVLMTRRVLEKIERGDRSARIAELIALAYSLHMSPVKLLFPRADREVGVRIGSSDKLIPTGTLAWWLAQPDEAPAPFLAGTLDVPENINDPLCTIDHLLRRALPAEVAIKAHSKRALRRAMMVYNDDVAVFNSDLDFRITTWNRGAQKMYGYTEHEALGMFLFVLMADREVWAPKRELIGEEIVAAGPDGEPYFLPSTERLHKDGKTFWVQTWLKGIFADPELIGFTAVNRRVPDPNARFEVDVPDEAAHIDIDSAGMITAWPPEAEELFGYSLGEAKQMLFVEMLDTPLFTERFLSSTDELFTKGHTRMRGIATREGGSRVDIYIDAVAELNAFGEIIGVGIRVWRV